MTVRFGFGFKLLPGDDEKYALILCRSIRKYAGRHKTSPIYAMVPVKYVEELNPEFVHEFEKMDISIVPFDYNITNPGVYYMTKSMAAGAAEVYATGKVDQLIYLDVESLVLNDPSIMALRTNKKLGIRPVDIQNIGLAWESPIDDFWANIYRFLTVTEQDIFPVIASVESIKLKTYLNACLLTVIPENGLLQKWSANLEKLHNNPAWNKFFIQDEAYRIFLHQSVMVGTMLAELNEDEYEIYPVQVNFPLYSYPRHPHKPAWIDELVTCRLDLLNTDNCWKTWLPMREPLKSWLMSQIEDLKLDI